MVEQSDRVTTEQLAQFLERVHDAEWPITAQQFDRFLAYPDGPTLPDGCVEVRRIPDAHRAHGIEDITVRPSDGALCYVVALDDGTDRQAVIVGDAVHIVDEPFFEMYDSVHVRVLGFTAAGQPVTEVNRSRSSPMALGGLGGRERRTWFYGTTVLIPEEVHIVQHACYTNDGAIVYVRAGMDHLQQIPTTLCRNGETIAYLVGKQRIEAMCVASDGMIYGAWYDGQQFSVGNLRTGEVLWSMPPLVYPRDIVEVSPGTVRIVTEDVNHHVSLHALDGTCVRDHVSEYPYFQHYTETTDGRSMYVSIRHDGDSLERTHCWVVDGVPGPKFEEVSPLSMRDGTPSMYWARDGQCLLHMEIHAPSADAVAHAMRNRPWHYPSA